MFRIVLSKTIDQNSYFSGLSYHSEPLGKIIFWSEKNSYHSQDRYIRSEFSSSFMGLEDPPSAMIKNSDL